MMGRTCRLLSGNRITPLSVVPMRYRESWGFGWPDALPGCGSSGLVTVLSALRRPVGQTDGKSVPPVGISLWRDSDVSGRFVFNRLRWNRFSIGEELPAIASSAELPSGSALPSLARKSRRSRCSHQSISAETLLGAVVSPIAVMRTCNSKQRHTPRFCESRATLPVIAADIPMPIIGLIPFSTPPEGK